MLETKSVNGRLLYKSSCSSCGRDRGFIRKTDINKMCGPCAISIAMKGKPSPKRGLKTGKPAWNKKIQSVEHKIVRSRLSRRLRHAFDGRGLSKANRHTFDILGYTVKELKVHLESKFQPGMSWNNYGEWHIDHVIPDSWFSYTSENDRDFKESWALSNLQPLWKMDNIRKNNRYAGGMI